ncbi:MAG: cysteine hydrolase family protein [Acidobacteriaceae bacterium]|nr:cysteine hydrolase family protein [Acidobacteriaceae bacterium]MBV9500356.1 cysteine hydrolase family protein [Acidobacteriaceae bacterium]
MRTVFFDVDTQLDFLFPAGALAVPGAETIVKSLGELTSFAAAKGIQIVSTADAHPENDPEFAVWKPHCIVGTTGQQKVAATTLARPSILPSAPDSFRELQEQLLAAPQIIVEKQDFDCFTNPNLGPLLESLRADRFVVYGVATEHCVRCGIFGLLRTGVRVELVTDAIKSLVSGKEKEILDDFVANGGQLTTVRAATAS